MQVLTRTPTAHMLQLLAAIMTALVTANSNPAGSATAAVVPQLWSAVLGLLQHGAPAAKLSVVSTHAAASLQRYYNVITESLHPNYPCCTVCQPVVGCQAGCLVVACQTVRFVAWFTIWSICVTV